MHDATWRDLYEATPDPLLTVDHRGVVVACNRTTLEWLGAGEADVVGRPLAERFTEGDRRVVEGLVGRGWAGAAERRLALRDGRRVVLNAATILGSPARWHVTVHDVTNRAAIEEATGERQRTDDLSALAGEIARELNDPMSIVQGRLELLLELGEDDPEALRRHLEVALLHARRVSATLQNLRQVGHQTLPYLERVFLLDAIAAARELVGPRLRDRDLRVDLRPQELAAGGEEGLYARILCNLVDRALDVGDRRGTVEIRGRRCGDGVEVVVLGGPRIAGVDSVPPPDESASEAEGLPMAIVQTLVGAVGGTFESRVGGGRALFRLVLPGAPSTRARARPAAETLLVVGKEELRRCLEELLGRDGFRLCHVPDAESAMEQLADEPFAAVLTDLLLPGMSGLSLVQQVERRHPGLRGRLVLVSATPVAAPGTARVLRAPLRREDLLAALGRRVRKR